MRNWMLTLSTIVLSGVVAAQMPGTFNGTPQQNSQPISGNAGGYIVSPPTLSLGNGITPTVVTNQDTVNVTLPQNTSANGQTVQSNNPANTNAISASAANTTGETGNAQQAGQANRNFDFVAAPNGGNGPIAGSMADSTISLGDVARKARNGKQIAKRSITNADVNAWNGNAPDPDQPDANGLSGSSIAGSGSQQNMNGAATQTNGGTAGAVQPPNSQSPAYSQPSTQTPFSAPTTPDGSKPNAQQGPGIAPRGSSPKPATPHRDSSEKPQLPRTSSALPFLGTLGAVSTIAGIGYLKLR